MPRKTKETATAVAPKKPAARRSRKQVQVAPTWEHVAERAYFIHLESGGDPLENWLQAERELLAA
jgi:Protein of unknown function (DUF2934)